MTERSAANPTDPKSEALRRYSALHRHPERVRDPQFLSEDFFDPRDLVQVKYEMVRRVQVDSQPVSRACSAFGFSRPVFYRAQTALAKDGLPGLLPNKRGPRGGHKLTVEVMRVIEDALAEDRTLGAVALVEQVQERCGVTVHPRSIQRALARRKKKRP